MKCFKKIFIAIASIFVLILTSCDNSATSSFNEMLYKYPFAKWVSDNEEITLICQGTGYPFKGKAILKNEDELCEFSLSANYYKFKVLYIHGKDEIFSYVVAKKTNNSFVAEDVNSGDKHIFTYVKMDEDEIDLRFLQHWWLKNKEINLTFYFNDWSISEFNYRWGGRYEGVYYKLNFDENKTFYISSSIDSSDSYFGTYIPNFESVIFNFENEGGFYGMVKFELFYYVS